MMKSNLYPACKIYLTPEIFKLNTYYNESNITKFKKLEKK